MILFHIVTSRASKQDITNFCIVREIWSLGIIIIIIIIITIIITYIAHHPFLF